MPRLLHLLLFQEGLLEQITALHLALCATGRFFMLWLLPFFFLGMFIYLS